MATLTLTATRKERAQQIIAGVRTLLPKSDPLSAKACAIALQTACAEAILSNPASYKETWSLSWPHDWVAAGDHASVGEFQQQPWWGTHEQLMTVSLSCGQFLNGNGPGIPGLFSDNYWKTASTWLAAQHVQRSAFSDGSNYRIYDAFAWWLYDLLSDTVPDDGNKAPTTPTVPPGPAPAGNRFEGKPIVGLSQFNTWVNQPGTCPKAHLPEIMVVFRAAALRGIGSKRSKFAKKGILDQSDHGFAVGVIKAVQKKMSVDQTGVLGMKEINWLSSTKGSLFNVQR